MSPQPDVEIVANIRAEELRFECEPHVDVRVHADPGADVERLSDRENLPEQIEPGVTYKDIAVTWRIGARLREPDF